MLTLASPSLWFGLLAGLTAGIAIGVFAQRWWQVRQDGGRSVAALQQEIETYRADVNAHFLRTSELFKEMTERYREVYDHLAEGADMLCSGDSTARELEDIKRRLLAARGIGEADPQPLAREGLMPAGSGRAA